MHTSSVTVTIGELQVADTAEAWRRAGFAVDSDAVCSIGGVGLRLLGRERGTGIASWALRGLPDGRTGELDGIPTAAWHDDPATPGAHPNGIIAIDHLVLLSPDLNRTVKSLAAVGVRPRRERDGELGGRPIRQVFFRLGEVIVEVVGSPTTAAAGAFLGEHTTPAKDAVQPGRRITTLHHRAFDMSVRTALISPPVRR
jgi:hypothetical protein